MEDKILYKANPSMNLLGYWFFVKVLPMALIILLLFGLIPILYIIGGTLKSSNVYTLLGGYLIIFLIIFIYHIPLLQSHKYSITNQHVQAEAGVLSKRKRSIQIKNITDITISQNILEQLFNISNLGIQTASTSGRPEISFIGIKDPKAPEKVLQELLKK